MQRLFRVSILVSFVVCFSPLLAVSQGIQQTPYSAADVVRRSGPSVVPDLTPSNPLGMPGGSILGPRGSENISISSGMFQSILPKIPNLQLGYNYTFGPQLRAGSASADYLLPVKIDADTTVYGEAHGEFQTLSISQPGSPNNSTELCFGGGYRRMLGKDTLVGLHSFFNTAKLSGTWYPSASAGVEFASMISGHDAIDFIFNWYGKALDATIFGTTPAYAASAATANFGNANFDFQVGYSHELYNGGPDLRLSATGYKLECGSNVYGYYGGAELKSRDGVYVVKYDVGYDNAFDVYQSVAAFVNMGFQLENLLDGKSPFVKPKPIFQSPRNMTTLTQAKPSRNWKHTTQAATSAVSKARASNCLCNQTITVYNQSANTITLYVSFQMQPPNSQGQVFTLGGYTLPDSFNASPNQPQTPWTKYNASGIQTTVTSGSNLVIYFPCTQGYEPVAISADQLPQQGCNSTLFEINMCSGGTTDWYDISLVNGFNHKGEIKPDSGTPVMVCCPTPNKTNPGVFPWGCDTCVGQTSGQCSTSTIGSPCPTTISDCKSGTQYNPSPYCVAPQIPSTNYKLYIGSTPDLPAPAPAWCPTTCDSAPSQCCTGTCLPNAWPGCPQCP